jgi:hypothetical protein
MLRVASNALIVPPFECAWLSLDDYQLEGACCLQFEYKGTSMFTFRFLRADASGACNSK